MKKGNLLIRLIFYICGLVIMTLGVAVSVKADLGVSTISSIPYTMTCITGLDLGIATIVFSIIMILIQMIVLRKNYKKHQLLQLPVSILFGLVMTCCTRLTVYMPEPGNMAVQLLMCLGSTVLVAIGLFLYVPA